jgi:hypothetical protein
MRKKLIIIAPHLTSDEKLIEELSYVSLFHLLFINYLSVDN